MANLSFTTTNWAPWFAAPNQLAGALADSVARTVRLFDEFDVVSESLTGSSYHAEFTNGGTVDVSGSGLDTSRQTITAMTYSDSAGNSIALAGNLTFDINAGTGAGAYSTLQFRFSGLEIAAAGSFSLDANGGGTGSFSQIVYKQSGWSMQAAGNVTYQGFQANGALSNLTVTSPQGDSFSLSDSQKLTAPILNGIEATGKGMGFFLAESFLDGNDVMTGGDQNDRFGGYAGDDVMRGGAGNDTLVGGAGNDTIDGGSGTDLAVFSGNLGQYTRTASGDNTYTIRDNAGTDGIDTLSNVERLHFTDVNLALDVLNGHAGTTARILGVVFGPSSVTNQTFAGIGLALLDNGVSYPDLMMGALTAKLGGGFSNADEVALLYLNLFGHGPTPAEATFWSDAIDSGQFSQASLAIAAAQLDINASNVDLVGLTDTGLAYLPQT